MRLKDEEYEEIKAEVTHLFIQHDIRGIPISGFELASKMGILLIPYGSLSVHKKEACMKFSPDSFYWEPGDGTERIYYNNEIGYGRCNMSILHEIGHCVLGHMELDPDKEEAEANFFAKYAAAPPPLVHKIRPTCPDDIYRAFDISHEAAYYAYQYYLKWLNCGNVFYTDYEMAMLQQFEKAN